MRSSRAWTIALALLAGLVTGSATGGADEPEPAVRGLDRDAKRGEVFYQTICVGCHGREGRFTAKRFLGNRARQDPWEAMHAIFNGHPDDNMPALRELGPKVVTDILAYAHSLQERR